MHPTKQQVIDQVQELVSLPDIYLNVRELLDDPTSSIDDFAKAVSYDPGLVARILRIANSAFFGFATKIDSIMRAISIMGTAQLHDLVLATSAIDTFNHIPAEVENMDSFWKKSIYCGVIAQLIGSRCNSLDSERYFVIGLLHNVGHLALCMQLPDVVCEVAERARQEKRQAYRLQREILGYDYAELGSDLLESWELPQVFVESIRYHLDPGRADNFALEATALHLANIVSNSKLAHANGSGAGGIAEPVWQLTGLNPDDLRPLQTEGDRHYSEAVCLLM